MIDEKLEKMNGLKDAHCKSVCPISKCEAGSWSPLSHEHIRADSLKPCTRLLRSCWICRFLFELFARLFSPPVQVCQEQHMIGIHQ